MSQDALIIRSPRPYQVIQRQSRSQGAMLLSGEVKADCDRVEFRLTGQSVAGPLPGEWQPVPLLAMSHSFCSLIPVPAGGWYRLEMRASRDDRVVAESAVDQVGVGEVFATAGQSNSTNCGQFRTEQVSGMVAAFSGSDWRLAADPLPGCHDASSGGSPWLAFGDALHQRYGVPVGIAATGHGGTSVNQWEAEGELFNWMTTRLWQLGPNGCRGLLWHQGESDVGMPAEEYVRKLTAIITASKTAAGWEFPWFVAKVSYHNPDNQSFETTRAAHQALWDQGVALPGPDTDILTGDHRDTEGKGIHFSPRGLKAHGTMWAQKVGDYLEAIYG